MPHILCGFFINCKGGKMTKFYILILFGVIVLGAYFSGYKISAEKCRTRFVEQEIESSNQVQTEILKIKEAINAETYNTSIIDIRGMLREKYTIKD